MIDVKESERSRGASEEVPKGQQPRSSKMRTRTIGMVKKIECNTSMDVPPAKCNVEESRRIARSAQGLNKLGDLRYALLNFDVTKVESATRPR